MTPSKRWLARGELYTRRPPAGSGAGEPTGNGAIESASTAASDDDRNDHGEHEQVVLEPFAQLLAGPIHEKSVLEVNGADRAEHYGADA